MTTFPITPPELHLDNLDLDWMDTVSMTAPDELSDKHDHFMTDEQRTALDIQRAREQQRAHQAKAWKHGAGGPAAQDRKAWQKKAIERMVKSARFYLELRLNRSAGQIAEALGYLDAEQDVSTKMRALKQPKERRGGVFACEHRKGMAAYREAGYERIQQAYEQEGQIIRPDFLLLVAREAAIRGGIYHKCQDRLTLSFVVLLSLLTSAHHKTAGQPFLGCQTLAERARLTNEQANRVIKLAIELGLVELLEKGSYKKHRVSVYQLQVETMVDFAQAAMARQWEAQLSPVDGRPQKKGERGRKLEWRWGGSVREQLSATAHRWYHLDNQPQPGSDPEQHSAHAPSLAQGGSFSEADVEAGGPVLATTPLMTRRSTLTMLDDSSGGGQDVAETVWSSSLSSIYFVAGSGPASTRPSRPPVDDPEATALSPECSTVSTFGDRSHDLWTPCPAYPNP